MEATIALEDSVAIAVLRMQRNFGSLKQQVEEWQALPLSTAVAKLLIYQAFIEDEVGFPKRGRQLCQFQAISFVRPASILRSG